MWVSQVKWGWLCLVLFRQVKQTGWTHSRTAVLSLKWPQVGLFILAVRCRKSSNLFKSKRSFQNSARSHTPLSLLHSSVLPAWWSQGRRALASPLQLGQGCLIREPPSQISAPSCLLLPSHFFPLLRILIFFWCLTEKIILHFSISFLTLIIIFAIILIKKISDCEVHWVSYWQFFAWGASSHEKIKYWQLHRENDTDFTLPSKPRASNSGQ